MALRHGPAGDTWRPVWLGWQEPVAPVTGTPRLPLSSRCHHNRHCLTLASADEMPLVLHRNHEIMGLTLDILT